MSDRMIRAALAMVASFGVLLALFGAVGAKAQEVDYDRLRPLFQITEDVCKTPTKAAMMVWEAKRNGFLRREWMMGIARSIGAQAELALLRDFDLDDDEAGALAGQLRMRDFMGEMVDRIYQPELYHWEELNGSPIGVCAWVSLECGIWVANLTQRDEYSEEAHRTRAALDEFVAVLEAYRIRAGLGYREFNEFLGMLTDGDGLAEEEILEVLTDEDGLAEEEILEAFRLSAGSGSSYYECYGKLGGYPHEVSSPSALPFPPLFNQEPSE